MKKILIVIVLSFLCASILSAEEKFDFRKTRWGMTKEEVVNNESGKKVFEDASVVAFYGNISGIACQINYHFLDGGLVRTSFIVTKKHSNPDLYVDDYERITSLLKEKYGEPIINVTDHRSDPFKGLEDYAGMAYAQGYRKTIRSFGDNNTEVISVLSGDNGKIDITTFCAKRGYLRAAPGADSGL